MQKKDEDKEESKEEEPKTIVVPRAVPVEDMFNHISDKLDLLFVQIQELKSQVQELKSQVQELKKLAEG